MQIDFLSKFEDKIGKAVEDKLSKSKGRKKGVVLETKTIKSNKTQE